MSNKNKYGARSYVSILQEGLQYIEDRRHGRIKSLLTPWTGLNQCGIGGLEWGSLLTIGARPGSGKTMIVSQMLRESHILNPTQDFNILEFQFEMGAKQYASRAFAAEVALDYNQVLSTDKMLDQFIVDKMKRYIEECIEMQKKGIYRIQINDPLTKDEIADAIEHYYIQLGGKPMIVTIDHSWLIKKSPTEKEKINTLYNTTETLMKIKKDFPIIVVMITQLNRTIDDSERKKPGVIGNYPTSSDIFGGDALMQGSDMVIALNRPYKSDIKLYGPNKYIVSDEDIFIHLLKIRNGADKDNILFMKAEFDRQKMREVVAPSSTQPSTVSWKTKGNNFTI